MNKRERERITKALKQDAISRRVLGTFIVKVMKQRKLTREATAKIVQDAPSQVSRMYHGHFDEFSADRMMKWIVRLGYNGTLSITKARLARGRARVFHEIAR